MNSSIRYRQQRERIQTAVVFELMVVFCLLVSLEFPGNYGLIYGEKLGKLMEYGAFGLELILLATCNADSWQSIELLRVDKRYTILYFFVLFLFAESMMVSSAKSEQAITCLRLVVTLLFMIWLQEHYSVEQILEMTCIAQGIFVMATLFFMLRHPGMAYESGSSFTHAFKGLYATKNSCATELGFGIIMTVQLLWIEQRRRKLAPRWFILLFVQFILLLMCKATGPLITVFIALIPMLIRRVRLPLGLIYITVNIVFLFSMLALMPLFEGMLTAMGKDATLTGRIPLWRQIIEVMTTHRTLTGYGYAMFWRDRSARALIQSAFNMRTNPFMASITTGSHNVLMEMWVNSGLLGIAAYFIALLYSFQRTYELEEERYVLCATLVFFLMMNGLTERCIAGNYTYGISSILLAMAVGCNRKRNYSIRIAVPETKVPEAPEPAAGEVQEA